MTRRAFSEGDAYHIMVRGVGRQIIFEDDCDRQRFCDLLSSSVEQTRGDGIEVSLLAWCLMQNHVHLLFRADLLSLSPLLRATLSQYARYFNYRHDRVGTLFQGRFKSVPIKDDAQLLTVLRYIHHNPLEIGRPIQYRWSSYREYLRGRGMADVEFCLDVMGGLEQFRRFHEPDANAAHGTAKCEGGGSDRVLERHVAQTVREVLHPHVAADLAFMEKPPRDELLARLRNAGLTIKQIELATGIGRGIIARAKMRPPGSDLERWDLPRM